MSIQFDFTGKVLAVSGAVGGIARATAELYYRSGASLALTDIDSDGLARLSSELGFDQDRVLLSRVDVRDSVDCEAFAREVEQKFGRVDVLLPAAGISQHSDFESVTDQDWRRTLSINLDGVFYMIRALARLLPEGSSIVNLASMAANRGPERNVAYGASKGAVVTLTRSLCRELASRGVRVNAVAPGPIATDMIAKSGAMSQMDDILAHMPLSRLGRPEEIAVAIAFLSSPEASFITGEILHVNGGYVMGG